MSNGLSGHPLNHPLATKTAGPTSLYDQFGVTVAPTDDPAWQPPADPMKVGDPKVRARTINREIPIVTVQTSWDVASTRRAIEELVAGLFDEPAQLVDAIIGDARVQSALASRSGGLLGRPIQFIKSELDEDGACIKAWEKVWPCLGTEAALGDFLRKTPMMGFQHGQLMWDTSDPNLWVPYLSPWHARYTYYHWMLRKHVAVTLDGQVPITPGDGHWVTHAPFGEYRGWMHGAMRSIAPWWLARNYALRDWARYSERHGMPILKAVTPWGADSDAVNSYRADVASLGQESVIQLPQSNDDAFGKYDLQFLEASDQAWLAFLGLITQCNGEITLALLGQNLTTEVKEGSFAAARVHADVRQAILEADARSLEHTIYTQISRPFAAINFGNPDLAPSMCWEVSPVEDAEQTARTFASFGQAVNALRQGGIKVSNLENIARDLGIKAKFEEAVPVQVEAKELMGKGEQ